MQKELGSQFSQLWRRDGGRCAYWGTWNGFWTSRVLLHLHSFSSVAHRRMTMDMSSGRGQTGSKPTFLVWLNGLFSLNSTPLILQKQTKNKTRRSVQSLALSSSFVQFRVRKLGVTRVSPPDIKSRDVGETAMMMGGGEAGMEGGRKGWGAHAAGRRLRRGAPCAAVDTGGCRLRRASARRRSGGCSRSTAPRCAQRPAQGDSQRNSAKETHKGL